MQRQPRKCKEARMLVVILVVGLLVGVLAYRDAGAFKAKNGVAPWRLDPIAWGAIVFVTGLLIGGVLYLMARRTTKPAVLSDSVWAPSELPADAFAPVAAPPANGNPYASPVPSAPAPAAAPTTSLGRNILPGA
jgi:hypothetical protein